MATRKLHIGGSCASAGWEVLNVQPGPWVDHVGDAADLSRFDDGTFAEVYASHVLEHLDYQTSLPRALAEWYRVLIPGGSVRISVPDLDVLCELFLNRHNLEPQERFHVMRMMFGGHMDPHDFHASGLNEEFLQDYLVSAGFSDVERVSGFGLFDDSSNLVFYGRAISLNLQAHRPNAAAPAAATTVPVAAAKDPAERAPAAAAGRSVVGRSAAWGQGYCTATTYGGYSFRELAPNWIDYALLGQRQRPPRSTEGQPFRYLELGSGMGVGLCLLAAAYPEGEFVGVDFHPSHIAHSQWLARELHLANITFVEGDFLQLAADPGALGQEFHYVVAHGILSWIAVPVREALFGLAASCLLPGGAFCCSYNTFPGWLERTTFKALVDLERQRMGPDGFLAALDRASETLGQLVGLAGTAKAPIAGFFPDLGRQLLEIRNLNKVDYLCGEYGSDNWQPFYVAQVHQLANGHKLDYVASASLPENHPSLLPQPVAQLLAAEPDPLIQQTLLDLAIKQSFRRDLFVKGPIRLSGVAQEQLLAQQLFCLTTEPALDAAALEEASKVQTTLGTLAIDAANVRALEALLAEQPLLFGEIQHQMGMANGGLVELLALLLHAGRLGLHRGAALEAVLPSCRAVNQRLMDLMQGGHNLSYLAAPALGHGAHPFTMVDAFVLAGIEQGLEGEVLASCVWMGMEAAGVEMRAPDGSLLTKPEACFEQISRHVGKFCESALPRLKLLGITGD